MDLDIWLGALRVARTEERSRGKMISLVFTQDALARYGVNSPLLSCALLTTATFTEPAKSRAFLEGLLPEGRALETMASTLRGVSLAAGAPESSVDSIRLLAEYGRECAGAVVAVPAGEEHQSAGGRYEPLDVDALAAIVRNLPRHPLGADLGRDIRMSLSGAQPKFLLARIDDAWFGPIGGAPSTHILKPTANWPDSARNEALIMNVACEVGLTTARSWTESMGDIEVFVAERYDRLVVDGRITRLHQEDMCQAIGIRPADKYSIGRPSERMAAVLREFADSPGKQVAALFKQAAFRALVGDEDGHGKNYSLLHSGSDVKLAPLYDSLTTLAYPELSGNMASRLGRQIALAKVDREALVEEARAMRISVADADAHLESLIADIRRSLSSLDDSLTTGWRSEQVIDLVINRIERLEAGDPMGMPDTAQRPRRRTLDAATRNATARVPAHELGQD